MPALTSIKIFTQIEGLAGHIATDLSLDGRFLVRHVSRKVESSQLRIPVDLASDVLAELRSKLAPFEPATFRTDELTDNCVELDLGGPRGLDCKIRIYGGATEFTRSVAADLQRVGFKNVEIANEPADGDRLLHGGAGLFAIAAVTLCLRRLGCFPRPVKQWGDNDLDIYIHARRPLALNRTQRAAVPVEVRTDAGDVASSIVEAVQALGFREVRLKSLDTTASGYQIAVQPGILETGGDECGIAALMALCDRFAGQAGVDPRGFPVLRLANGAPGDREPVIHLPLRRIHNGLATPYAGSFAARYKVRVCTDDRSIGLMLTSACKAVGFNAVSKRMDHDLSLGFAIRGRPVTNDPEICEVVREILEREMLSRDILGEHIAFLTDSDSETIEVLAPFAACREGVLARELNNPKRFTLVIRGSERLAREVAERMAALGFDRIEVQAGDVEESRAGFVEYGGAPTMIIEELRQFLETGYGEELRLRARKVGSMTDLNIVINLPTLRVKVVRRRAPKRTSGPLETGGGDAPLFVEADEATVRIGEVTLDRRPGPPHALVPEVSRFGSVCIDTQFAALLEFLVRAVLMGSPARLVGQTGVSKSMSVTYLAGLLNQPLDRLNLSGQSDTGDLIGRFVPSDTGWRWHPTSLPKAMREGIWLLLDEYNLSEAHVLERGNPAYERPPSLVISEFDNEVIGSAHSDFWIVATANPSGGAYAGRNPTSPAFKARFTPYLAPSPGESENLAFLTQAVLGTGPDIELNGRCYRGVRGKPTHPDLAEALGDIFEPLARFHAAVTAASFEDPRHGSRMGDGDDSEAPTFSRRQLDLFLQYLARFGGADGERRRDVAAAALDFIYLKGASDSARTTIRDLAQAAGLPVGVMA